MTTSIRIFLVFLKKYFILFISLCLKMNKMLKKKILIEVVIMHESVKIKGMSLVCVGGSIVIVF